MKQFHHNKKRSVKRGLTVVELLAATVLASMLMISVVTVLQTMNRSRKTLLKQDEALPWMTRLTEQLEWELINSSRITLSPGLIQIVGFNGRDFQHRSVTHVRSLITYRVVKKEGQSCLIRQELHPDSVNLENSITELVGTGIDQMLITSVEISKELKQNPETIPEQPVYDDAIPQRLSVILYQTGKNQPVLNHAFTIR